MGQSAETEESWDWQQRELESWHRHELLRLGFTRAQTKHLMVLLDENEMELATVRDLVEKRGWTPFQAFLSVA